MVFIFAFPCPSLCLFLILPLEAKIYVMILSLIANGSNSLEPCLPIKRMEIYYSRREHDKHRETVRSPRSSLAVSMTHPIHCAPLHLHIYKHYTCRHLQQKWPLAFPIISGNFCATLDSTRQGNQFFRLSSLRIQAERKQIPLRKQLHMTFPSRSKEWQDRSLT